MRHFLPVLIWLAIGSLLWATHAGQFGVFICYSMALVFLVQAAVKTTRPH